MALNLGRAGWRGAAAARDDFRADRASGRADRELESRLAADTQRLSQMKAESEDYKLGAPARAAGRSVAVGSAEEFAANAPVRETERRARISDAEEKLADKPLRKLARSNEWTEATLKANQLKLEQDRMAEEQGLQSEFSALQKEYDEIEGKKIGVRKQFMSAAAMAAHIALSGGDKAFAVGKMKKSNPYVVDYDIDQQTGDMVIREQHPETGATFDRKITKPEYMGLLSAGMPSVYGDKGRTTEAEDRALKQDTVRSVNAYRTAPRPARELTNEEKIAKLSSAASAMLEAGIEPPDVLLNQIKDLAGGKAEAPAAAFTPSPEDAAVEKRVKKIALTLPEAEQEAYYNREMQKYHSSKSGR